MAEARCCAVTTMPFSAATGTGAAARAGIESRRKAKSSKRRRGMGSPLDFCGGGIKSKGPRDSGRPPWNPSSLSRPPLHLAGIEAMATVFVARSTALGKWASDVGLGKHIYRVGYTEEDPKALVAAAKWASESDWKLVKAQEAGDATEDEILARLAGKEKIVDPAYYPRLKGLTGVVRVSLPT